MKPLRCMALLCSLVLLAACNERRHEPRDPPPSYGDVVPLLKRACLECHGSEAPAAAYSVADHWSSIGCASDARVVTRPADARAPLLRALDRNDHQGLVSARERALLLDWLVAGTPSARSVIHEPGILDPRSADWHGKLAAQDGYRALRDASAQAACSRCHQGTPVAAGNELGATDGATACTSCHVKANGVLACSTCHGYQDRSYPPRDACYFDASARDPHGAHVAEPSTRSEPFSCDTCHPVPGRAVLSGKHADGQLDLRFSSPVIEGEAMIAQDGTCSLSCHTRGGDRDQPDWNVESPLDCQSCHLSPPPDHTPGVCSACHSNMGETADSLRVDLLHINGAVDLGDGARTCGSCHGKDASGAPGDEAHAQHAGPPLTAPIACATCHLVPSLDALREPSTHMNGSVDVVFRGRAASASHSPTYDTSRGTCAQVACHGDNLVEPRWGVPSQASSTCGACHRTPPLPPHSTLPGCGGGLCHGSEVATTSAGFRITDSGRTLHIDGVVHAGPPI
jgi:predicted CxxxxCH...CXXCH cytochrome family protein